MPVGEMLARIDSRELSEWMVYVRLEAEEAARAASGEPAENDTPMDPESEKEAYRRMFGR